VFDDSIFNPHRAVQRVGDFWQQRKAYRLAALLSLRRREGLPSPVDEQGNPLETRMDDFGNATYHDAGGKQVVRVLFAGAGRNGKPGSFAVGQRKGKGIAEAERHWMDSAAPFEILDVAEDGRKLVDEMADLHRDSATYERAERVSHGPAGEQAPDLVLDGTSDEEVDARLQEYLRRGPRMAESADEVDSAC
jgi:hypothetical protein